jgi:RNA polymerase sigma-70 factor, ECF subfamily
LPSSEIDIDRLFRQDTGRAVATIAKAFGDIQLAEDAVQEAYVCLLETSRTKGKPENPTAWIMRTARNCAIDRLRRTKTRDDVEWRITQLQSAFPLESGPERSFPDDRLELIFACCHPALTFESRVALTLRSCCGLTTRQIASAFFVPEATMMRRIARAKRKLSETGVSFALPAQDRLAERLDGLLAAIYLIFNEGYKASAGEQLTNPELCTEAIWLAGLVHELMPNEQEALGLYCLLLFTHARHSTRIAPDRALQTLEFQDRSRWNLNAINRAAGLLVDNGPL